MTVPFDPELLSLSTELLAKYGIAAPKAQISKNVGTQSIIDAQSIRTLRECREKLENRLEPENATTPKKEGSRIRPLDTFSKTGKPINGDFIVYASIREVLERASKPAPDKSKTIPSEEIRADIARIKEALKPYKPKESEPEQAQPALVAEPKGLA